MTTERTAERLGFFRREPAERVLGVTERQLRRLLLVFIDDATGTLMELRFCDGESTFN